MLFNKTATLSAMTRDMKNVSSWQLVASFACNIQPQGNHTGIGGVPAYNQYKMYTEYMNIKEGDKIEIDGIVYIVRDTEDWRGIKRIFNKVILEKSRGD